VEGYLQLLVLMVFLVVHLDIMLVVEVEHHKIVVQEIED
jgi:hypothetical protein